MIVPDHRGLALECYLGFLFVFLNVIIAKNCLWQDGASGEGDDKDKCLYFSNSNNRADYLPLVSRTLLAEMEVPPHHPFPPTGLSKTFDI